MSKKSPSKELNDGGSGAQTGDDAERISKQKQVGYLNFVEIGASYPGFPAGL